MVEGARAVVVLVEALPNLAVGLAGRAPHPEVVLAVQLGGPQRFDAPAKGLVGREVMRVDGVSLRVDLVGRLDAERRRPRQAQRAAEAAHAAVEFHRRPGRGGG